MATVSSIDKLTVKSYDGNTLNDANYGARLMIELPPQEEVGIGDVRRADESPVFTRKMRNGKTLVLQIEVKDGGSGSIGELMQWFDVPDGGEAKLVATDSVSAKDWYVNAVPRSIPKAQLTDVRVELYVADYIWRGDTEFTTNWAVTSDGDTEVLANVGNKPGRVKLDIKPTTARTGARDKYRMYARIINDVGKRIDGSPVMLQVDTASLVSDSSISNQIDDVAGISDSDLTITIDTAVGGGLDTSGGICYVGTEQILYDNITGGGTTLNVNTNGRGYAGTTAAAHADNAVITQSIMRADGGDIRIDINGENVDYWLSGMNTATTKIWLEPLNYRRTRTITVGEAVGTGTITELKVEDTKQNKRRLKDFPAWRSVIEVVSGSTEETFLVSRFNKKTLTFTVVDRALRGTSAAAHSVGDTIRWRQYDCVIRFGNWEKTVPTVDDTKEPAFLLTSTNTSFVYTNDFGDKDLKRPMGWKPSRIDATKGSNVYQGNRGKPKADPIVDLGMKIKAFKKDGVWRPGNATLLWSFYHPGGISDISSTGEMYREKFDWPEFVGLEKSLDGEEWEEQWYEAKPSAATTWTAWTHTTSTSLGTGYKHARYIMDGGCRKKPNNKVLFEVEDLTVTLTKGLETEVYAHQATYKLNCTITCTDTGDYIKLKYPMLTNEELFVDSDERTVLHEDGTNAFRALSLSSKRIHWLEVPAGATLKYEENNPGNLTIVVHFEERQL